MCLVLKKFPMLPLSTSPEELIKPSSTQQTENADMISHLFTASLQILGWTHRTKAKARQPDTISTFASSSSSRKKKEPSWGVQWQDRSRLMLEHTTKTHNKSQTNCCKLYIIIYVESLLTVWMTAHTGSNPGKMFYFCHHHSNTRQT